MNRETKVSITMGFARRRGVSALTAVAISGALTLGAIVPVVADSKSKASSAGLNADQKIIHLLNRIGFGPRPGDVERVKKMGVDKYVDLQLHPERIDDPTIEAKLTNYPSLKMSLAEVQEKYPPPQVLGRQLGLRQGKNTPVLPPGEGADENTRREYRQQVTAYYQENNLRPPQFLLQELQAQKIVRAAYSERQLQEVMTDFWFNHFNVFWAKNLDRNLTTDYEMSVIRPHTMGKFKDLLMATAKSPAMLFYLDNFQSTSLRGINENYARELMELHSMGVDGGYTQKDVQEVARAFTGWSIEGPRRSGKFIFRPRVHDAGEKVVLGHRINAGGMKDGEMVIDILAHHPGTARFIATKLVTRFVSDNPPESLISRVAGVFRSTDGNIREMLRTIFTSSEFYSSQAMNSKMKSPFELAVSAIRALNGTTDGSRALAQMIARMGQPLYQYQPPTGFPDRASEWTSNGSIVERLNFAVALAANRIPGTTVSLNEPPKDVVTRLGSPEFQTR
jgi:uncharacterized protein (DUF1800 family)